MSRRRILPDDDVEAVSNILGTDQRLDPDPLIGLGGVAALAGVARATPGQWRWRSTHLQRAGAPAPMGHVPFPEPDPMAGGSIADKPLWRATSVIVPYLRATGRWPSGKSGRPAMRRPRRAEAVLAA